MGRDYIAKYANALGKWREDIAPMGRDYIAKYANALGKWREDIAPMGRDYIAQRVSTGYRIRYKTQSSERATQ